MKPTTPGGNEEGKRKAFRFQPHDSIMASNPDHMMVDPVGETAM
jgi:hypothetical protein